MDFSVITIFPDIIRTYLDESIVGKAREKGIVNVDVLDLRDFTEDRHRTVDDTPYGGGPGMVMKPEPIAAAVDSVRSDGIDTLTVMVTPQGRLFSQTVAEELAGKRQRLLLICGRYEGIDDRVAGALVDDEISIGDYVLTGGELPALVIIDAVVRLLPGVLGDEASLEEESFSWGILDYPHYTRPLEWRGMRVPDVLLSGNHGRIGSFRRKEALRRTLLRRPDLVAGAALSAEDDRLIREIKEEEDGLHKGD
jgi:tRNA (guanine37-N1)-methyltransferase